jgi:nicotinic acid phosphoribosyltransferase
MNIIELAKEAGFGQPYIGAMQHELKRFAKLVAAHEREACESIVNQANKSLNTTFTECAAAIRARGEK